VGGGHDRNRCRRCKFNSHSEALILAVVKGGFDNISRKPTLHPVTESQSPPQLPRREHLAPEVAAELAPMPS